MSSTVAVGGLEITSNTETAADMARVLKPIKEDKGLPRIVEDGGTPTEAPPAEEPDLSKAAAELGRKGGEAAAKAREAKEKEAEKPKEEAKGKAEEAGEEGEEKPSRAKARIEEIARQRAEERKAREAAEERARELEARLARLEALTRGDDPKGGENGKKGVTPGQGDEKGKQKRWEDMTPDEFDEYDSYVKAMIREAKEEGKREAKEEELTQQRVAAVVEKMDRSLKGFKERFAAAREADPSFTDRIDPYFLQLTPAGQIPPGRPIGPDNVIAQEIMESDHGPKIMVYLSEHPEEMKGLLQMESPQAIVRAVGRLEVKVADMPAPLPQGGSKAPPPMRPVSSTANPGEVDWTKEMDLDTFVKLARSRRK